MSGIAVNRLEDTENIKHSFEITGMNFSQGFGSGVSLIMNSMILFFINLIFNFSEHVKLTARTIFWLTLLTHVCQKISIVCFILDKSAYSDLRNKCASNLINLSEKF